MSSGDLLGRVSRALDTAAVPYMVVGSFASTYHGRPRTTQDLDVVIDPTAASLAAFLSQLDEASYYVSQEAARDALERRGMFNVIDLATGWKVDLIVRKARAFSEEEFRRRRPARILDLDVLVATAEDTVLAKLEWAALGESERQLRDVQGVIDVRGDKLDVEYLERWALVLGVSESWQRLKPRRARRGS